MVGMADLNEEMDSSITQKRKDDNCMVGDDETSCGYWVGGLP